MLKFEVAIESVRFVSGALNAARLSRHVRIPSQASGNVLGDCDILSRSTSSSVLAKNASVSGIQSDSRSTLQKIDNGSLSQSEINWWLSKLGIV